MELIKHFVNPPQGVNHYGDPQELSIIRAPHFVQEIWYWYVGGGYEGAGHMLMRAGDEYKLCGLNHCSCYPPGDGNEYEREENFVPFDQLAIKSTEEARRDVQPLLDAARP